ncbi:DUF2079 domain-containing protein [Ktedonospora formicarum]|uniref:DUF2079 domain-containing protein n=1 Tax=Ktedonospora formicarum TaxID=2778364 RepID=A0A8J3HXQ3_9CHLR|nr:DUF2079 domain-containing protein [Ktedonospora formicarum]GHO43005.1 hypothetical protein KSX_11680 [Ktedonospora formicarum]
MVNTPWSKRLAKSFSIWQNRLYLYPRPEPLPRTRLFWVALGLVTMAVAAFSVYFIILLTTRHSVFLSNAEDLGIMDQALWSLAYHGDLHQTICNIVNDTNCYSPEGISRFSIHFEPILWPISWLYYLWADPRLLLILQTLIVASGAYPAFLLARLRLRSDIAGVMIALLYLLYPAQQQATIYDFHAVTLTTSLLLFTLYFMYTRRTAPMFIFALLSMACKEEIPLVIAMFCLWSMVFQRRWRSSAILLVIAIGWFCLTYYYIFPHFSPTGKPLLSERYGSLGNGPGQVASSVLFHPVDFVHRYLLEPAHFTYLKTLWQPALFLPLLAPWVLILSAPTLALNLLSSHEGQYSGLFQYNAEIVPVLIFATIEAVVLLLWLSQILLDRLAVRWRKPAPVEEDGHKIVIEHERNGIGRVWQLGLMLALLGLTLFSSLRTDYYFHGALPFSVDFQWPQETHHTQVMQQFVAMVPPNASISAQTRLVPHLSHRQKVYLFPYASDQADYVLLDLTGDIYPFFTSTDYTKVAKDLLLSGQYGIVKAEDGVILLKRGLPAPGVSPLSPVQPGSAPNSTNVLPNLPAATCDNTVATAQEIQSIQHPIRGTFSDGSGSMQLVGYDATVSSKHIDAEKNQYDGTDVHMILTTYWQVVKPITTSQQILFVTETSDGKERLASTDVPLMNWCQSVTWKPGSVIKMQSNDFFLAPQGSAALPKGLAHISVALVPLTQPSSTILDMQARLRVAAVKGQGSADVNENARLLRLFELDLT